jgi:hypothetical protein
MLKMLNKMRIKPSFSCELYGLRPQRHVAKIMADHAAGFGGQSRCCAECVVCSGLAPAPYDA